ncbi:MAG: hypothetical protein LBF89_00730 [Bacteroidales bacterium]|jgi:hypothetical protein|nr:hypothetical protein [Bacteroidales bacterium]
MESIDNQNKGGQSDEIDIFEFCSRLYNVFKSFVIQLKDFFVAILILLIRKSLWIISFAVIGIALGVALYNYMPVIYSSQLIADTGGVNNSVFIDQVNRISRLVKKPERLANFLQMDEEQAKKITFIKAYYGIDINRDGQLDYVDFDENYNAKDTSIRRLTTYLCLKVSVKDESIFVPLKDKILWYLQSNEYIRHLHEISIRQKIDFIHELDREMSKIDSIQNAQLRQNMGNFKEIVLMNKPEMKLFHSDMLSLYSRKQSFERDTAIFKQPISVIQDFTLLGEEDRNLQWYIFKGCVMGAITGLCFSLLWQYRKRIYQLIREEAITY